MADRTFAETLRRAPSLAAEIDRSDLRLKVEPNIGIAKLQILGNQSEDRFTEVMKVSAPKTRRQIVTEDLTIAWMAPGEWLVTGDEAFIAARLPVIAERGGDDALVVDLTHGRTSFELGGSNARSALAGHCPLDLWPDVFPVDAVARSLLGDAGMFIARLADDAHGARFRIIVDQTMARYAARMLAGPPIRSGAQQK